MKKDLEIVKRIINFEDILACKLSGYADYSVDPQIKQILNQRNKKSLEYKEKLEKILFSMEEKNGRKMDG